MFLGRQQLAYLEQELKLLAETKTTENFIASLNTKDIRTLTNSAVIVVNTENFT